MGYKRMKKRKLISYKHFLSVARKAYRETKGVLGMRYVVPDGSLRSFVFDPSTKSINVPEGDVDAMKWFESPNAEGYLDM